VSGHCFLSFRPEGFSDLITRKYSNKAVSDGAAAFYLDHYVESRLSRVCFGVVINMNYKAENPDHVRRKALAKPNPSTGVLCFSGSFSAILPKVSRDTSKRIAIGLMTWLQNEQVRETKEYRKHYSLHYESLESVGEYAMWIMCYKGECPEPVWMDQERGKYSVTDVAFRCTN
jgi:hypothetical protein